MTFSQYNTFPIAIAAVLGLAAHVLALTVFIIGLLASAAMSAAHISAVYFAAALAFQVAPAGVVLSSFLSGALWLIAGGLVLGVAAIKTGLGARVAATFTGHLSRSYATVITSVVLSALILAFLIPAAIARFQGTVPARQKYLFSPGERSRFPPCCRPGPE
ncbi:MAG: anion permease [Rhodospirillaceae bacterium]